jgi:hypothetical protein
MTVYVMVSLWIKVLTPLLSSTPLLFHSDIYHIVDCHAAAACFLPCYLPTLNGTRWWAIAREFLISCASEGILNFSQNILPLKWYKLYKVLAHSTTFFHLSLSCATFFQLFTFKLLMSPKMSSSQLVLGLPIGCLDMGFHLLIFW